MTDVRDNLPERSNGISIVVINVLFAILVYWFYSIGEVPLAGPPTH